MADPQTSCPALARGLHPSPWRHRPHAQPKLSFENTGGGQHR